MGNDLSNNQSEHLYKAYTTAVEDFNSGKKSQYMVNKEKFYEDFKSVSFIGKTCQDAIDILVRNGYNKYKILENRSTYLCKILDQTIIIFTSDGIVTKEPQFY